jgi:hypothetical protein
MDAQTAEQVLQSAASLFSAFAWSRLLPLLSFVIGGLLVYWMMAKAQRADPTFQAIDFLRDETTKPSWKRLIGTMAFGVHSWVVYIRTVTDKITFEELVLYALTWSSSVVLIEGMRIWRGGPLAVPAEAPVSKEKPDGS